MSKQPTQNEWHVLQRAEKVWDEAQATYQIPDDVTIVFRLLGSRSMKREATNKNKPPPAGIAHYDSATKTGTIFINRDAVKQNMEWVRDDVVPHEIAHIVCFILPHNGSGHNDGWEQVCKRLGGTGRSTFNDECDLRITKTPRYLYAVPGIKLNVEIGPKNHEFLQSGQGVLKVKATGQEILAEHFTGRWL